MSLRIPQRRRVYLGCEGASEQSYGKRLNEIADAAGLHLYIDCDVLQPGGGDPLALVESAIKRIRQRVLRRGPFADCAVMLDTDKLQIAGGLKGKGIKVIQSFDSPIDVPAGAEIYLEGYIDTNNVSKDGPLGEISGYYMTNRESPTMIVNRLAYQKSPVYHALLPTSLEGDTYLTFVSRAHVEEASKKLFPFIVDITFVQKTFGSSVIVSVKPADRSRIHNMLLFMLAFPMIKKVVVVDEDVDPHDLRDVEWALVTRCLADKDIMIIPDLQGQPIDPQAEHGLGVAKIGIDATKQDKTAEEKASVSAGNRKNIERILKSIGGVC